MDPVRLSVLLVGAFFLAFGLAAYRHFFTVLGATAGLAVWMALSDTLVRIPGLREHPGTARLLILVLFLLAGVFLAKKFRRLLAFSAGMGTGLILSQTYTVFMAQGVMAAAALRFDSIDAMDVLVGLIGGILFLLFERFLAVILTSVVGSFLCTWAIGGRWTFLVCLAIGLVAQPLIFGKFRPSSTASNGGSGSVTKTLLILLPLLLTASPASADWSVERIHIPTSRLVIAAGWRDGIREGESYAVIDDRGSLVIGIEIGEVFSASSYSLALPRESLDLVRPGMRVLFMEEYAFNQVMGQGGETPLLEFLERYPDSDHRQDIIQALDEARYRAAEMEDTVEGYREFQRKYPTSRFGAKARHREEELVFLKAWEVGTEGAFRHFLDRFRSTSLVSGMPEVRAFLKARETGKVYAYQEFLAAYPRGRLAAEFLPLIDAFEVWAEKLEFGSDPAAAIRYFGELGDETAVPLLIGKLGIESLEEEARGAILRIGKPGSGILMEVLISPLQNVELKDKVALILGEMGDIASTPALRSYYRDERTPSGHKALLMLEEKAGR